MRENITGDLPIQLIVWFSYHNSADVLALPLTSADVVALRLTNADIPSLLRSQKTRTQLTHPALKDGGPRNTQEIQ